MTDEQIINDFSSAVVCVGQASFVEKCRKGEKLKQKIFAIINRQKEEKKFRESLQKGQQIVTIGGMHGKIAEVKETTVVIEVAHDVRIEMEKASIAMSVANQK